MADKKEIKGRIISEELGLDAICTHDTVAYITLYSQQAEEGASHGKYFRQYSCIRCNSSMVHNIKETPYQATFNQVVLDGVTFPLWVKPKYDPSEGEKEFTKRSVCFEGCQCRDKEAKDGYEL